MNEDMEGIPKRGGELLQSLDLDESFLKPHSVAFAASPNSFWKRWEMANPEIWRNKKWRQVSSQEDMKVIQDICLVCMSIALDVRVARKFGERGGVVKHQIRDDHGS